jgi:RNase P/RNase MRP subunit POP5
MPPRSFLLVQSTPVVSDPREFETIVTFSLRSLFGDLEPHSCGVKVTNADDGNNNLISVDCPPDSVASIRSALTMPTFPPYMDILIPHRFDIVKIKE